MTTAITREKISLKAQAIGTIIALISAVALPQIIHVIGAVSGMGTSLGEALLPMHLPIILVGLLAGSYAAEYRLGYIVNANRIAVLQFNLCNTSAIYVGAVGAFVVGDIASSVFYGKMAVSAGHYIRRDHYIVGVISAESNLFLAECHEIVLVGDMAVIKHRY